MIRRIALVALALAAACSADTIVVPVSETLALAVDSIGLRAGDSVVPTITVTVNGVARPTTAREIRITSSDTSVITVTTGGALVAVGDGTADVTVMWNAKSSVSVTRTVAVTSENLTAVSLVAPISMVPGDTASYIVTGTIRGGRVLAAPTSVMVTSRNDAVATASGDQLIAVAPGATWIVVRASTGVSDSSYVRIAAGAVARLALAPRVGTLTVGESLSTTVTMNDRRGNVISNRLPTYTSSAPGVATVVGGVVTARGAGSALVIATMDGAADTLTLAVNAIVVAPTLARLAVSPPSLAMQPGDTSRITVTAFDTQGSTMVLPLLTWTSATNGITVSGTGLVQASGAIVSSFTNGVVRVSSGGVSAQVSVSVTIAVVTPPPPPPPPADNGYVQIRWVGGVPVASVAAAFEAARARINSLFRSFSGVTSLNPAIPAGYCMEGAPALNENVNGIVIFAQVTTIDGVGQILGSAGPCLIRGGTLLPIVATMQFDSADMNSMVANGKLNGVVLHEMMHTLGFGTIWGPGLQNEVASPSGPDPRYLGSNGDAAYAALGAADAGSGAPVENTGLSGTRGAHWRESIFRTELMTGWADGAMAMSRVTVGALKDFGYDVDLSRADAYTLPSSLGASLRSPAQAIAEQTKAPIGVVGGDGRITPYGNR